MFASKTAAAQVHTFRSTGQAYDESQTGEKVKDGDVLHVPSEGVVGYMHAAWPVAVTKERGAFHHLNDPDKGPEGEPPKVCSWCHGAGTAKETDNAPFRKPGDTKCWGCGGKGGHEGDSLERVKAWHGGWNAARNVAQANGHPLHTGSDPKESTGTPLPTSLSSKTAEMENRYRGVSFPCKQCGTEVTSFHGRDAECHKCDQLHNSFGQRIDYPCEHRYNWWERWDED